MGPNLDLVIPTEKGGWDHSYVSRSLFPKGGNAKPTYVEFELST